MGNLKQHKSWEIEQDITLNFHPDIYDKIYKFSSKQQRDNADWYLAELAIKAKRDGKKEVSELLISNFINEQLSE